MRSDISEINQKTSRQAMGLPKSFLTGAIAGYEVMIRKYENWNESRLIETLTKAKDLRNRYAAGVVLAFRGDRRTREPRMVFIPGGATSIGLESTRVAEVTAKFKSIGVLESWIQKETPKHTVILKDYFIGKYPVTNGEYLQFLVETQWPELPTSWAFGQFPAEKSNHPVYTIKPEAAEAYCEWLSKKTKRKFRLPQEAEWEFAAAGPQCFEYPWGDTFKPNLCNTLEAKIFTTTPVGMFPESDSCFGVSDLAGNVEEYVAEDYSPYPGGPLVEDDLLLQFGKYRVARGGSFTRYHDLARCKRRHGFYQKDIYVMGFRIVEEI